MIVAGLDIGNLTTEVAIAKVEPDGTVAFLGHAISPTTGIKGTSSTIPGARMSLEVVAAEAGLTIDQIDLVRINEAAPVVAGIAMQAITQTILTDSTLIGHNPETPGGIGLGTGVTTPIRELAGSRGPVIALVESAVPFEEAAALIRNARERGVQVTGVIVQADDGVLIANRIGGPAIPIVDEVAAIERVPIGQLAAVEVAAPGASIQTLCNPFGLASLFGLNAEMTAGIAPAARALTGLRSAVVIQSAGTQVESRRIEPGMLKLVGTRGARQVDLRAGAAAIEQERSRVGTLIDVRTEPGTSAAAMFGALRAEMAEAIGKSRDEIKITDLFAADLSIPQPVAGGLSNEVASERAVALAAMIEADAGVSRTLADALSNDLGVTVVPGGSEAQAGIRGAMTTPGTGLPLCVIDLGSGSTNAARIDATGSIAQMHMASGGAMVNLLLGEELGIADGGWREDLKRYRVARAESLFTLRHEEGTIEFLPEPVGIDLFGRSVLLHPEGMRPVPGNLRVEQIVQTRQRAKRAVFGSNALRAVHALAPGGNPRFLTFVVLIGGSALDFELPGILAHVLSEFGIVTGTANVRGSLGPRNAVATGLILGTNPT